jgi:hypothetical protein
LDVDKRAERSSQEVLDATFVDSAPLYELLSTRNHQVIYGRRGTGKTHALKYLQKQISIRQELPIYIDLRNIGSSGSIYGDTSRPLAERASILIRDVLQNFLDSFYGPAVSAVEQSLHPQQITIRLDDFQEAITEVKVSGTIETEETSSLGSKKESSAAVKANISSSSSAGLEFADKVNSEENKVDKIKVNAHVVGDAGLRAGSGYESRYG